MFASAAATSRPSEELLADLADEASPPPSTSKLAGRAEWLTAEMLPHRPWLRHWIAMRFPREADLDDVVQESFERVLHRADPAQVRNPRAYLGQTAHIIVLGRMRRRQVVQFELCDDFGAIGLQCGEPLPDEQCIAREALARVELAFAALPERTRRVVQLRRLDGLSLRDTAAELGVTESAIEKHMSRAMKALRAAAEPPVLDCVAADEAEAG